VCAPTVELQPHWAGLLVLPPNPPQDLEDDGGGALPAGPVACEKHSTEVLPCERQQISGELGVKGCHPAGQM
jgi:hypothetical protein